MSFYNNFNIDLNDPRDKSSIEKLQKEIFEALDAGATELSLNLESLNYIDSSGIALLVRILRRISQLQSASLKLDNVKPQVQRILEISALQKMVQPGELIIQPINAVPNSICAEDFLRDSFTERFAIKADPGDLYSVREKLKQIIFKLGFSEKLSYDILVAVSEACSNSIEHSGCGSDQKLEVVFSYVPGTFAVEIKDYGCGFDYQKITRRSTKNMSIRGRGILIMKALMDEVTYEAHPDGLYLKMIKKIDLNPS